MKRDERPVHPGDNHWRSLEQLAGDPRARSFAEREFPEGASEPPAEIPRREMLKLLGASLSLAGLAACRRPVEKIVPYVNAPEEMIPGVPRHYATTMPFGHSAYGLVVESHEGRPTKIEGNPLHPSTLGASSLLMQASILGLYDPDRSRSPRRAGEPAGWPAFASYWSERRTALAEGRGSGLAVLAPSFSSPTLMRLARALREAFPAVRWVTFDPVSLENVYRGIESVAGRKLQPQHHLARARAVVALDSDFLVGDPESVVQARGFADGRRMPTEHHSMNRLWVAEPGYTPTGAMADRRTRVRGSRVGALVAALARELRARGRDVEAPAGATPGDLDATWVAEAAANLVDNAGAGLVLAGPAQPPAVHAAVLALNAALGNVGATVTYHELPDATFSSREDLADLVGEMQEGRVDTLVLLGGNPVYDAPADLDFAGALAGVEHTIHLADRVDETSSVCAWHLPRAHYLEAWGDCRAVGGTRSVTQPLIEPLFGGRSEVELLALLAGGTESAGYDEVRRTWGGALGDEDFESGWRRVLHDGVLAGSALPAVAPRLGAGALRGLAGEAGGSGLEVAFRPSRVLHDGRFANNGWLQELPDPVTKVTWDNAALLSPATARERGVTAGDVVVLGLDGREVEAPVWIVPGLADGVVALELGYGRSAAGRVGNGVGFSAYALRTSTRPDYASGLTIEPTGRKHVLASTQDHGTMQGRPILREATLEHFREQPRFARDMVKFPALKQMMPDRDYESGYQWGMSIDLNVCTGCNACVVACQSENNVPVVGKEQVYEGREMHWLRVDRYFSGEADDPSPAMAFQPVPCMQCENAPCEQVCPVAATVHDSEGLNVMVYNRCIGTRYCSNNCPYKVRRFNFFNFTKHTPEIVQLAQNPDVTVRSRGVMEKCTYCTQRINAAKIDVKLAVRRELDARAGELDALQGEARQAAIAAIHERHRLKDGDVQTACQQACPTQAIVFGNRNDPDSELVKRKAQPRDYALLEELNNRPRTTYLAKLRNPGGHGTEVS